MSDQPVSELISDNLWPTLRKLAARSSTKRAAVSYVTTDAFIKFGDGDVLVTDASDSCISSGQTSAKLLANAHKRGAELYSLPGLHAKVLLLDGTAVIGSANLSETSANDRIEAAWVTKSPDAVGMATSLIQQLVTQAHPIDEKFIARISRIKVKRNGWAQGAKRKPNRIKVGKHRTWVIGVEELTRDYPEEAPAIEEGTSKAEAKLTKRSSDVSWIRWTGISRFRSESREGDSVIQIWSRAKAKEPSRVYRQAPILFKQNESSCTRFFIEDFQDAEKTSITWKQFNTLLKRTAVPGKFGAHTSRLIDEAYPTFQLNSDRILPSFLSAYFKSPRIWAEVATGSKGLGDRRQRVHPDQVLSHKLLLPPIEWQERLQQIQERLDDQTSAYKQVNLELNAMLPAILDRAFKGEL